MSSKRGPIVVVRERAFEEALADRVQQWDQRGYDLTNVGGDSSIALLFFKKRPEEG